jgi:hypothetical protein
MKAAVGLMHKPSDAFRIHGRGLNRFAVGQRLRPWSFCDSTSRREPSP